MSEEIIEVDGTPLVVERIYPFRMAWLNDLHAGSQFAIWPDPHILGGGHTVGPSEAQKSLLKYFWEFAEECKDNKVNILCILGDIIMGKNWKEGGAYSMNIEIPEQVKACASLIKEFCDRTETIEQVWIWKGTGYHESRDSSVGESLRDKLVEFGIDAKYKREYSWVKLKYAGFEKTLFVAHSASGAYMYPEQSMGRDMMLFEEAHAAGKLPKVDMIVRAHKHSFIGVHKPSIRAVQLPCWQFFVPYDGAVKMYPRYQPDIGGVIMLFDHRLRSTVWHFTYPNIVEPMRFLTAEATYGVKRKRLSRN